MSRKSSLLQKSNLSDYLLKVLDNRISSDDKVRLSALCSEFALVPEPLLSPVVGELYRVQLLHNLESCSSLEVELTESYMKQFFKEYHKNKSKRKSEIKSDDKLLFYV